MRGGSAAGAHALAGPRDTRAKHAPRTRHTAHVELERSPAPRPAPPRRAACHLPPCRQALLARALRPSTAAKPGGGLGAAEPGLPLPAAPAPAPLSESLVAGGTLAAYLAHLRSLHGCVRHAVALPGPPHEPPPPPRQATERAPLDVLRLLRLALDAATGARDAAEGPAAAATRPQAAVGELAALTQRGEPSEPAGPAREPAGAAGPAALLLVAPVAAQYVTGLARGWQLYEAAGGAAAAHAGAGGLRCDALAPSPAYLAALAGQLRAALALPALAPGRAGFGAAAMCVRSVLEDAASHAAAAAAVAGAAGARVALPAMPLAAAQDSGVGEGGGEDGSRGDETEAGGSQQAAPAAACGLAQGLRALDAEMDARLLELCCPGAW